jgi:hypothetical protein
MINQRDGIHQELQIIKEEVKLLDQEMLDLKVQSGTLRHKPLKLLSKFKEFSKHADPDQIQAMLDDQVKSELAKVKLSSNGMVALIRSTSAEWHALKERLNALEITLETNIHETFSDADRTIIELLQFQDSDPPGTFASLEHELTGISHKFESGGGVDIHGFTFFND